MALGQFLLSPRNKLCWLLPVYKPCVVCALRLGVDGTSVFLGPDVLIFFLVVVFETLVSHGCNIVWYPNPVPCWNCVTAVCWAPLVSSGDLVNGHYWEVWVWLLTPGLLSFRVHSALAGLL